MRRRNWRVVVVGLSVLVLAAGFFLGMTTIAPRSNDPVALMRTVGQVSGVGVVLGLLMIVVGAIGRKNEG